MSVRKIILASLMLAASASVVATQFSLQRGSYPATDITEIKPDVDGRFVVYFKCGYHYSDIIVISAKSLAEAKSLVAPGGKLRNTLVCSAG